MSLEKHESSYIVEPYFIESHDSRKSDGDLPKIQIGKYCSIGKHCTFSLTQHLLYRFTTSPSPPDLHLFNHGQGNTSSYSKGDIVINNDVWIGLGCILLDGITIGNGAVIGAGSVVTKDVKPYSIVGGNPAKLIKYRFPTELIERIEALRFWEMSMDDIQKINIWSEDIEDTIQEISKLQQDKVPRQS
jgi:acetyltransferase-like isoleucine patch superfamily enzyme